jgi:hypothetical protein
MFTTPQRVLDEAKIKKEQAKAGEARPLALR